MVYQWLKSRLPALATLPGLCLLCGASTPGTDLCPACRRDLPWNHQACECCALPLASPQPRCGACLADPPPYRCRALFRYDFPLDRLLADLKYHGRLPPARALGELLAAHIEPPSASTLLLPVPLHPERLRERGYNQAAELARPLEKKWGLPLEHRLVRRVKATSMQKGLTAEERARNLRQAFVVDQERYRELGSPTHITLVDDVVTTGATATTLARALRQAGVTELAVLALARTA